MKVNFKKSTYAYGEGVKAVTIIEKIIKGKCSRNILNTIPEQDIMVTLKEFNVTKEEDGYSMAGLIVVDKNNIVNEDGKMWFKEKPERITIYENNERTCNILKEVFANRGIFRVRIKQVSDTLVLDMFNYKSVKRIYNVSQNLGKSIKSDNELVHFATSELTPRVRFVKLKKNLGEKAFEGSNVHKYSLNCMICYDAEMILEMETIQ